MKIGNKKIFERLIFFLGLFLGILSLGFKVLFLYVNSTAFTYDQARDLLDLREMVLLPKLRLVGATTSLQGVFFGPLWYWLALPFYGVSKGNPLSFLAMNLLISICLPICFFILFEDKKIAIFPLIIYLFSFTYFQKSVYALNVNPVVFIFPLFIFNLVKFLETDKLNFLRLTFFLTALFFHFEITDGVKALVILITALLIFKKFKFFLSDKPSWLFFLIPLFPQILFDFRHKFIQSRSILNLLLGKESSLASSNMDLKRRIWERGLILRNYFWEHSYNWIIFLLFLLLLSFLMIKGSRKERIYFSIFLISLGVIFLFFIIYPYNLWAWYFGSIDAVFATFLGLTFGFSLNKVKNFLLKFLIFGVFCFYLYLNISRYLPTRIEKVFLEDPGNLRTRLAVIDSIYFDSKNKGFKIYSFVPYVYDYPYQYLIWWRAKNKYGYLPEEYTYLPDQKDYVPAKKKADNLIPSLKAECTYLIIEPSDSQEKWFLEWRGNFGEARRVWEIGKIKIEKLCN